MPKWKTVFDLSVFSWTLCI